MFTQVTTLQFLCMWYLLASFCLRGAWYICSSIVMNSRRHTISAATNIQQRSSADMSKHRNIGSSIILNNTLKCLLCRDYRTDNALQKYAEENY